MTHIYKLAKALPTMYETDAMRCEALRRACVDIAELRPIWPDKPIRFFDLCDKILTQINLHSVALSGDPKAYLVDRTYEGQLKRRDKKPVDNTKKCFICGKPNCWSTNHTKEERLNARRKYRAINPRSSPTQYYVFLKEHEGLGTEIDYEDDDDDDEDDDLNAYFTIDEPQDAVTNHQADEAAMHALSMFLSPAAPPSPLDEPVLSNEGAGCYVLQTSSNEPRFLGLLPDTGASSISTAGLPQFEAFERAFPATQLNWTTSDTTIRFGKGSTQTIGSVSIMTPIGRIDFHVVPIDTPFLICLNDLQRLKIVYDTAQGQLLQEGRALILTKRGGHLWLEMPTEVHHTYFLTETELRRLHRRFGHPESGRLASILEQAGQEFSRKAITRLTEYCRHCQLHGQSPRRFRFSVNGPFEFNHGVIMDVMTLSSRPVLHLVDEATAFQAATFLRDYSAKTTWTAFKRIWIDTYIGPHHVP